MISKNHVCNKSFLQKCYPIVVEKYSETYYYGYDISSSCLLIKHFITSLVSCSYIIITRLYTYEKVKCSNYEKNFSIYDIKQYTFIIKKKKTPLKYIHTCNL